MEGTLDMISLGVAGPDLFWNLCMVRVMSDEPKNVQHIVLVVILAGMQPAYLERIFRGLGLR